MSKKQTSGVLFFMILYIGNELVTKMACFLSFITKINFYEILFPFYPSSVQISLS